MTATDARATTYGLQTSPDLLLLRYRTIEPGVKYHGGHDHRAAAVHPLYLAAWGIDRVRFSLDNYRCDMVEAMPDQLPPPGTPGVDVVRGEGAPEDPDPLGVGLAMMTIVYTCASDRIPDRCVGHVAPDGTPLGCCGWERRIHLDWSTGAHVHRVADR